MAPDFAERIERLIEHVLAETVISYRWSLAIRDDVRGYVEARVSYWLLGTERTPGGGGHGFDFAREVAYFGCTAIRQEAEKFDPVGRVMVAFNQKFSLLEQIAFAAQEDDRDPLEVITGQRAN